VQSTLSQSVARAQVEHRLVRTRERAQASETQHPPSVVRRGLASAVARVAGRLDAESARQTLALK
jgi:hypothetical protein